MTERADNEFNIKLKKLYAWVLQNIQTDSAKGDTMKRKSYTNLIFGEAPAGWVDSEFAAWPSTIETWNYYRSALAQTVALISAKSLYNKFTNSGAPTELDYNDLFPDIPFLIYELVPSEDSSFDYLLKEMREFFNFCDNQLAELLDKVWDGAINVYKAVQDSSTFVNQADKNKMIYSFRIESIEASCKALLQNLEQVYNKYNTYFSNQAYINLLSIYKSDEIGEDILTVFKGCKSIVGFDSRVAKVILLGIMLNPNTTPKSIEDLRNSINLILEVVNQFKIIGKQLDKDILQMKTKLADEKIEIFKLKIKPSQGGLVGIRPNNKAVRIGKVGTVYTANIKRRNIVNLFN